MARKTLAEHTADVMREAGETQVDLGELEILADAYERHGGTISNPEDRALAVINALVNTSSGKRLFRIVANTVMYPGIIDTPIKVIELRNP